MLELRIDASQIAKLGEKLAEMGKEMPQALVRAINHTGDKAKTQMIRVLVPQTGLKRGVIVRALRTTPATRSSMSYVIRSKGGDISLRYFGARETRAGVSAAPRGQRRIYTGAFMKGGRYPNRVPIPSLHGQVMQRTSRKRTPLEKVKSGVYIPVEMTSGASAEAFDAVVRRDLPDRVVHEVSRILGK